MRSAVRTTLRLFWGAAATLVIGTALIIQLGRMTLPLVTDWRDSVRTYLVRQLQYDIRIGAIEANWEGLSPELQLTDFEILVPDLQSLEIESARVQLNLLRSLLHLDWRFGRMEIHGVKAGLQQSTDGRWSLAGFDAGPRRVKFNPMELPLMADFADLRDISLLFYLRNGHQEALRLTSLSVQNHREFHRMRAELDLPGKNDAIMFVYEGVGVPGNRNARGEGYLRLDQYSLLHSVALASENASRLPGVRDGSLSAEVWMQMRGDKPVRFEGDIHYRRGLVTDGYFPEAVNAKFMGRWHSDSGWQVGLRELQSRWQGHESAATQMLVSGGFGRENIDFQADELDLGYWTEVLGKSELPEKPKRILKELQPAGLLRNISVTVPWQEPAALRLRGELRSASVQAWKGAPAVEGLDAYVESGLLTGKLQIDSGPRLQLGFPQIYRLPFDLDAARGEVAWQVSPDADQVVVNSGLLNIAGRQGRIGGYFYLDVPLQRNSRPVELILQLGLAGGSARDRGDLMPKLVPDEIESWVNRAVLGAEVPSAGFVLRGRFTQPGEELPEPRSIQLALEINDATLEYDPRWPVLENFSGRLYVDAPDVDGWIRSGRFLAAEVQTGHVAIRSGEGDAGLTLDIRGKVSGDASSGLAVLRETPLREVLGGGFDDWSLAGKMLADVDLLIPLGADKSAAQQQVDIELSEVQLSMQRLDLKFGELTGELRYHSEQGLSSSRLDARLWEKPLTATISSHRANPEAAWETRVEFETTLPFQQLAEWSARPELLFLSGSSPVQGEVTVAGENIGLQATTNLRGVQVELPAPYGKLADEERALDVEVPISKEGIRVNLNYSDRLFANLVMPASGATFGTVGLGRPFPPREGAILVEGKLSKVNGREWQPLLQRYQDFSEEIRASRAGTSATQQAQAGAAPRLRIDAVIEDFRWDDLELSNVQVGGGQVPEGWQIRIDSADIAGDLFLFDDARIPLVQLDYLHWTTPSDTTPSDTTSPAPLDTTPSEAALMQPAADGADPLRDFDPGKLPALRLGIRQLSFNGEDYGSWSLRLQPQTDGLLVDSIVAQVRKLSLAGGTEQKSATADDEVPVRPDAGARLWWLRDDSGDTTRFEGVVTGRNLADVTDAWDMPRLLESRSVRMRGDLSWPGSPANFAIQQLSGTVQTDIRNGRFYQATGQASSAFLRLVGLFNFDNWAKRLQLDFSDIYKGGTAFDRINGEIRFARGMIHLDRPLELQNTSSKMQLGGSINLIDETLDASLVATLPVGGNATLLAALIGGLPAAAGVYIASKLFEKQVDKVASLSYRMEGSWSDPQIRLDRLFDNTAAEKASEDTRRKSTPPNPAPTSSAPASPARDEAANGR